ncbi:40S ribosomal protein S15 isoform X1 [Pygocentrus nattereri]|uniref:40S ribosomal protein S15 isoform X1 n=1 Tax=Pygocentrus nattereri TaxID=42514 RepID=UPI001891E627|nr:40S ribosomal protein S15 isoform X1 [Pygocentrus nattereri]
MSFLFRRISQDGGCCFICVLLESERILRKYEQIYYSYCTADVEQKKKRTFRKFTYRGVDLDQLLDMSYEQLMQLYCARQRRRLNRGLRRKQQSLLKRLRKAKKEAPPMEKPEVVKTHLRDMVILPEMVGSMVGVYNGKTFNQVEIKPEMIGHYLGEFSITYKPVKHGRPGIGATHSSRFIPLK